MMSKNIARGVPKYTIYKVTCVFQAKCWQQNDKHICQLLVCYKTFSFAIYSKLVLNFLCKAINIITKSNGPVYFIVIHVHIWNVYVVYHYMPICDLVIIYSVTMHLPYFKPCTFNSVSATTLAAAWAKHKRHRMPSKWAARGYQFNSIKFI